MATTFRPKVLRLANDPNPQSILNLIGIVRKNKKAREELANRVALDAGEYEKEQKLFKADTNAPWIFHCCLCLSEGPHQ